MNALGTCYLLQRIFCHVLVKLLLDLTNFVLQTWLFDCSLWFTNRCLQYTISYFTQNRAVGGSENPKGGGGGAVYIQPLVIGLIDLPKSGIAMYLYPRLRQACSHQWLSKFWLYLVTFSFFHSFFFYFLFVNCGFAEKKNVQRWHCRFFEIPK